MSTHDEDPARRVVAELIGNPELGDLDLVVDTNVLLEATTAELWVQGDRFATPAEMRTSPAFRLRQLRAKCSIVLAWECARRGLCTLSLQDEFEAKATSIIPPASTSPANALTRVISRLVMEHLFAGWRGLAVRDTDFVPAGSEADGFLLQLARAFAVPLITNEGLRPGGISANSRSGRLRRDSRLAGVLGISPKEYLELKDVDIDAAAAEAHAAFRGLGLEFFRKKVPTELHGAGLEEALHMLLAYYAFVLLDEASEDAEEPPRIAWHP